MTNLALGRRGFGLALPGLTPGDGIMRLGRHLGEAIARHLRNRRGERQLWEMSEHQLHDLGITRDDIRRVAWQGDA